MSQPDSFGKIAEIISKQFGISVSEITPSTQALDVDGWDSITHTEIIISIEEAFDIEFKAKDIAGIEDVGALAAVTDRYVASSDTVNEH